MPNIAIKKAGDESGQTLVEYALIITLVGLAVTAALSFLAGGLNDMFTQIANAIP